MAARNNLSATHRINRQAMRLAGFLFPGTGRPGHKKTGQDCPVISLPVVAGMDIPSWRVATNGSCKVRDIDGTGANFPLNYSGRINIPCPVKCPGIACNCVIRHIPNYGTSGPRAYHIGLLCVQSKHAVLNINQLQSIGR